MSPIKYQICDAKISSKYRGDDIGWAYDYEECKTKQWIHKNYLKWFRKKYNINPRVKDKTIINNIIIEKVKPETFPKYNNDRKIKIKGYNGTNPEIEKIRWDIVYGWTYRIKNAGHVFQAVKEEDISFVF